MRVTRFVSVVTLLAFLFATTPRAAAAAPAEDGGVAKAPTASTSSLRRSIDRAGERAASQFPRVPERARIPVRKQMSGGGGGGGMMFMTLVMTAASLAGTYFLVKELKKSSDETAAQ